MVPHTANHSLTGGRTCWHDIAPLRRHHHRLETHTPWSYRRLEPRVFLWTDPTGSHYLHDDGGTSVIGSD